MSESLRKLQLVELEMLKEFDRICRENDLKYYVVGGTLLGAIRHKGFIPWDDDIDVSMPLDDYNKFCKACENGLDGKYFLQTFRTDENFHCFYAKLRKNGTLMLEKNNIPNIHHGIWIDIFPMIGVSADENEHTVLKNEMLSYRKMLNKMYSKGEWKNLSGDKKLMRLLPGTVKASYTESKYKALFKSPFDCDYTCIIWGDETISARYPSAHFAEICELEFEDMRVMAPKAWDVLLTIRYGDYMKLPPLEQRGKGACHTIEKIDFGDGSGEIDIEADENFYI